MESKDKIFVIDNKEIVEYLMNAIKEKDSNKEEVKEVAEKSLTKELGERLLELYKRLFVDEYSPTIPQEKVDQELIRVVDKLVKHVAYLEEELDKYGKR
ncbi:hypothetical protein P8860_21775 [Bacillus spizizenii]|uniref:Uncharacterized protein n=1 Tax=Bacillus spizizenii TaxID=96241 RepID=A0A9Q4DQX5_BACSC|nr:hypothetical protein [Bacillus spizizenii]MEC0581923.1 hypothetical protein [Bacillus spizizenii]MEC0631886.1 hypothetical protein [Bacillus spizizenii]